MSSKTLVYHKDQGIDKNLGANDAFASLQTAEIKAAYLLQMIAIELHKASKEIDSTVSRKSAIGFIDVADSCDRMFWLGPMI